MDEQKTGTLYIVATPIGNSRDMSPRGVQILTDVDIIAAEDTRRSMVLLGKLEIRNKLVSNHKFNEYGKAKYFINEMKAGKSVAVITDAGTPCISDPGKVKEQLLAKGNYDKGEYAIVAEVEPEYQFTKVEHTVSAEAMLVDAMISGGVSGRDAIAAVLADPNNSYSKNELKAAALNLKRMFE